MSMMKFLAMAVAAGTAVSAVSAFARQLQSVTQDEAGHKDGAVSKDAHSKAVPAGKS